MIGSERFFIVTDDSVCTCRVASLCHPLIECKARRLEVGELIFSERCGLPGRRRLAEQWMLTLRMVSTVFGKEGLSPRRRDATIRSEQGFNRHRRLGMVPAAVKRGFVGFVILWLRARRGDWGDRGTYRF